MMPLFSNRRHLDASHTHPKSGLRAESAFPYPCSDTPLEGSSSLGPGERVVPVPMPATGSQSRPPVGLCPAALDHAPPNLHLGAGHPGAPNPSATDKLHSRLLLWLPFLLAITHVHTSLVFDQSLIFNEAHLASPRVPGCP